MTIDISFVILLLTKTKTIENFLLDKIKLKNSFSEMPLEMAYGR